MEFKITWTVLTGFCIRLLFFIVVALLVFLHFFYLLACLLSSEACLDFCSCHICLGVFCIYLKVSKIVSLLYN
eukprot:01952.XXX_10754_10972_1 [CDS] Oithona nana genome sequencing.